MVNQSIMLNSIDSNSQFQGASAPSAVPFSVIFELTVSLDLGL